MEELGEQEIGRLWSSQAQVRGLPYAMVDKRFIRWVHADPHGRRSDGGGGGAPRGSTC